ncbi:MAG TPA: hypothetical protein VIG74_02370 [Alphaproteobacteria bacterium]|jgi:hypothetical protein
MNEYVTTDLGEAIALHCVGFKFLSLRETGKRGQRAFVFESQLEITPPWLEDAKLDGGALTPEDVVGQYRHRNPGLLVNAADFYGSSRIIKDSLYNELQKAGERQ